MRIDLHIHSKSCSDGHLTIAELIQEAKTRHLELISITDHDSINCQEKAKVLAQTNGIMYISGVELNVAFLSSRRGKYGKPISLDILGYQFDIHNQKLRRKLQQIAKYREERGRKILENINAELDEGGRDPLPEKDFQRLRDSVDGVLGRPHIARWLVDKGIVETVQEAFDKYLVRCDVPKYPLDVGEASNLLRDCGGIVVLAHPNDPHGTSLLSLTESLSEQGRIIEDSLLKFIDGIECWHSRNDAPTTEFYVAFARKHGLVMTGGSDCHQKPILMGTVKVPKHVALQFDISGYQAASAPKGIVHTPRLT